MLCCRIHMCLSRGVDVLLLLLELRMSVVPSLSLLISQFFCSWGRRQKMTRFYRNAACGIIFRACEIFFTMRRMYETILGRPISQSGYALPRPYL